MEGPYIQIAAVAMRAQKRSIRAWALPVADRPLIIRPCMGTSQHHEHNLQSVHRARVGVARLRVMTRTAISGSCQTRTTVPSQGGRPRGLDGGITFEMAALALALARSRDRLGHHSGNAVWSDRGDRHGQGMAALALTSGILLFSRDRWLTFGLAVVLVVSLTALSGSIWLSQSDRKGGPRTAASIPAASPQTPVDWQWRRITQAMVDAADLRGADLNGANLDGLQLSHKKLDGVQANGASFRAARCNMSVLEARASEAPAWKERT